MSDFSAMGPAARARVLAAAASAQIFPVWPRITCNAFRAAQRLAFWQVRGSIVHRRLFFELHATIGASASRRAEVLRELDQPARTGLVIPSGLATDDQNPGEPVA